MVALFLQLGRLRVVEQNLCLLDLAFERLAVLRFEGRVENQHCFELELRVIKLH